LCGPTGTGKTILIKDFYSLKINHKEYSFQEVVFSSRTTCTQVQDQIESKLDKRGSKYLLGPKSNPKMILFVDDLNMPVKEIYGAQPPIEFLRQIIDQKGFFDLKEKDKTFKTVVDLVFVYSMAATNNDITPRLLRHINLISVTNFDEDTLTRIFTTILNISFQGHP
jgi:dynein heavy chain